MPVSVSFSSTQNYTIPVDAGSMRIRMWGGGGGGEFIATNLVTTSAGGNGGNTSWLGITCFGGQGGGVFGKNTGGAGGGVSSPYPGSAFTGAAGSITSGGTQADNRGNGGNGTLGLGNYGSSVFHIFDNINNVNIFTGSTPDINVNFENQGAPDGLFGFLPSNGKYYSIRFVTPYVNNNWSYSVGNVCNQAAAGGTNKQPYTFQGAKDKSRFGINLWFQTGEGGNTYIRCFDFNSSGLKEGAQGRGGGAGGYIDTTISRQTMINNGYQPGGTYTATVGGGGGAGGNTATGGGGGFISLFITIVPNVVLTATKTAIVVGECLQLQWQTTGDADRVTWLSGNVTNQNLTSTATVCPTSTTTYTAIATGTGGTSDPASVTVFVFSRPTASISSPTSINYGQTCVISYETQYANTSITITPILKIKNLLTDNFSFVTQSPITISPASSAFAGDPGTVRSGTISYNAPWQDGGPYSIQFLISAVGSGGNASDSSSTEVIIDTTPENILIEETEGKFKSENPVYTPDILPEEVLVSELYQINDIDVPIEIKSNFPIQVDINHDGNWKDVRQI